MNRYFAYILELTDKTYYIGYTNNLSNRLKAHNGGRAAKRTRGRTPANLMYYEVFPSKSLAMKREAALKKLKREEKSHLISQKSFTIIEF